MLCRFQVLLCLLVKAVRIGMQNVMQIVKDIPNIHKKTKDITKKGCSVDC